MKRILSVIKLAVLVLVFLILLLIVGRISGLMKSSKSLDSILFGHKTVIENTETFIAGINKISELSTACFFEEKPLIGSKYRTRQRTAYKPDMSKNLIQTFLDGSEITSGTIVDSMETAKIVYVVQGKVRAGYDLSALGSQDISISYDTLYVRLPEPEIFDVIVNPSDITEFDRVGSWSEEEINRIIRNAKEEIKKDAIDSGIMEKAESAGKDKLISLFKSLGCGTVVINE